MATMPGVSSVPSSDTAKPPHPMPPPTAVPTRPLAGRSGNNPTFATAIGVGEFVEASFASFERTYGVQFAAQRVVEDEGEEEDVELLSNICPLWLPWTSMLSSLIPILFLWTRRSMFGMASLLRSFLIGHALRLILTLLTSISIPTPVRDRASYILLQVTLLLGATAEKGSQTSLQALQQVVLGKVDPNACPPPALTLLALLTTFAFVVHPDGLTWVLLGKMRDGIQYLFRSSTLCLAMIKDGSVPTLAASCSLVGLIAIAGIIHRATSSSSSTPMDARKRSDNSSQNSSRGKHKGKKNGRKGHHSGGCHGRPSRSSGRIKSNAAHAAVQSPPSPKHESERSTAFENKVDQVSSLKLKDHDDLNDRADGSDSVCPGRKMSSTSIDAVADDGSEVASLCSSSAPVASISTPLSSPNNNKNSSNNKTFGKKGGRSNKNYHHRGRGNRNKKFSSPSTDKHTKRNSASPSTSQKSSPGIFNMVSSSLRSLTPPRSPKASRKERATNPDSNTPSEDYREYDSSNFSSPSSPKSRPQQQPDEVVNTSPSSSLFSTTNGFALQHNGNTPNTHQNYSPLLSCPPASAPTSTPPFRPLPTTHIQPNNTPSATFFPSSSSYYNLPNYSTTYPQYYNRYTPGKIELASFLAQAGLIGAACAQLLEDIADVDTLSTFTDGDYTKYNISFEKRCQIYTMLQARRRRMEHPYLQRQWSHPPPVTTQVIRPPPGLGYDSVSVGQNFHQQQRPSYVTYPHVQNINHGVPINNSVGSYPISSFPQQQQYNPACTTLPPLGGGIVDEIDETGEDDSNIEADLLAQVGGQMAVSILDF